MSRPASAEGHPIGPFSAGSHPRPQAALGLQKPRGQEGFPSPTSSWRDLLAPPGAVPELCRASAFT